MEGLSTAFPNPQTPPPAAVAVLFCQEGLNVVILILPLETPLHLIFAGYFHD